ncbi:MOSC domain-containing protein [uncultured Clostridium sp.]|uniref:MOSC domain-containing protein n=1 Tax=uncultured Clostridium sp. TaxID=59620 RepID=UPI00261B9F15|nr:MOSC domain-containing protein [uncultured Clostridium sp.]
MGRIVAICKSEKKGTVKKRIPEIDLIENFGLEGDAHGGNWHRQVSLLEVSKIDDFNKEGGNVVFGDFGENIVIEGIEVNKLPIGTKLKIGDAILEITQIGKKCHSECEIFYRVGRCIMPVYGTFSKVIKGGHIKENDVVEQIEE